MYTALLAAVALVSGVAADFAILYPNSATTWYYNHTVQLNWTAAETDAKVFRVFLENKDSNPVYPPQEIAQEIPTANLQFGILLPGVTAGDGYVVSFVNTTNTTQVYAKSEKFKIEPGTVANSSTIALPSSTAPPSSAYVPNGGSQTSSANPFASKPPSPGGAAARGSIAPVAAVVLAVAGAALAL